MHRHTASALSLTLVLAIVLTAVGTAASEAGQPAAPEAPLTGAPTVVSYQGQVTVGGAPYTGDGYFKFAVVDQAGATSYWSNDGTSTGGGQPTNSVKLSVSNGLFNVLLGDTALPNMTALPASTFAGTERDLRVWFSSDNITFTQLAPDRRIAAVPYTLQAEEAKNADLLDGQHASAFQQHYQGVKIVAKSGGDYTTVSAALAGITDAGDTNRYLVKVMPGVYSEQVIMKPYVDIEGSGELTTKITYTGSGAPNTGTVLGASNAELRYLSVENTGGTSTATAIFNVSASPRLTHITANASGGSVTNRGVENIGASPMMANVTISAVGGSSASYAVLSSGNSAPTLTNVNASASEGSNSSYGMYNSSSSATIQNSVISAGGASGNRIGIMNSASSGAYTVLVINSQVSGTTNSISFDTHFTVRVGASQLSGAVSGSTVSYAGSYDSNFTLNGNQTFSGIPAFNGGVSGSTSPFTVNSSTLVSSLNADLLDGQHAGNASGGIPLNNGTLNTNLNADLLDGLHASAIQPHYQGVKVVAKSGGDYITVSAALAAITDASDTNRYLVKVMPGVYSEQVTMKPYVDIEGAGELTTRITYTGSAAQDIGTVVGADNAELRYLSVENTGGNTVAIAIYNNPASPRLTHVTASASGGSNVNCGVYNSGASPTMTNVTASASGGNYGYGVRNHSSSPAMMNVSASASGGAVDNTGVMNNYLSSPTLTNLTASASGGSRDNDGVYNYNSTPTIRNSVISADGTSGNRYGIYNIVMGSTYTVQVNSSQVSGLTNSIYSTTNTGSIIVLVGASQLSGGAVSGGTVTCAGVYDEAYAFYASTCP